MNAKQRRLYERAQRVAVFCDAQAGDFPAGSKGGDVAASLKEELSNVAALDVASSAGASKRRQGTFGRRDARLALRSLVEAVSATGETIALDRPDLKGVFSLKGRDNSDQTLIAVARSHADAAAPHAALFVEYDLPATFAEDLRTKADSLEHYISLQTEGTGARAESSTSVEEALQRTAGLVERLDAVVRNKYREDPARLTAWERARRIESAPHSKSNGTKTPPPNN
jgi:hypothetical protein